MMRQKKGESFLDLIIKYAKHMIAHDIASTVIRGRTSNKRIKGLLAQPSKPKRTTKNKKG